MVMHNTFYFVLSLQVYCLHLDCVSGNIDLTSFFPCGILYILKNERFSEVTGVFLDKNLHIPFQLQVQSKLNQSHRFRVHIFPRMKIHTFIVVNIFDNTKDEFSVNWGNSPVAASFMRISTRVMIYFTKHTAGLCEHYDLRNFRNQQLIFAVHVPTINGMMDNSRLEWIICCPLCSKPRLYIPISYQNQLHELSQFAIRTNWIHPVPMQGNVDVLLSFQKFAYDVCDKWTGFDTKSCNSIQITFSNIAYAVKVNISSEREPTKGFIKLSFYNNFPLHLLFNFGEIGSSSLVFIYYVKPSIIYCDYVNEAFVAVNSNIWLSQIPPRIAFLILFASFCCAVIISHHHTQNSLVTIHQVLFRILAHMALLISFLLRQGAHSYKIGLVLLLQFLLQFFVLLYENLIFQDLVIPKIGKPFRNASELMGSNYTYLYIGADDASNNVVDWIKDNYQLHDNTQTARTGFCCSDEFLKNVFSKQKNGTKFALSDGMLENQNIYARVQAIVGFKFFCYKLFPPEPVFISQPYFTSYKSPIGEVWAAKHRRLISFGLQTAIAKWIDFIKKIKMASLQRGVEQNDTEWKNENEKKASQLFTKCITFLHLKNAIRCFIYAMVVCCAILTLEVCIFQHFERKIFSLAESWMNRKLAELAEVSARDGISL